MVTSLPILTQPAFVDIFCYTQFSCKAVLGGAAREMRNKAKLSLNWVRAGDLAELGKMAELLTL